MSRQAENSGNNQLRSSQEESFTQKGGIKPSTGKGQYMFRTQFNMHFPLSPALVAHNIISIC